MNDIVNMQGLQLLPVNGRPKLKNKNPANSIMMPSPSEVSMKAGLNRQGRV